MPAFKFRWTLLSRLGHPAAVEPEAVALLAGIPQKLVRQAKAAVKAIPEQMLAGWDIRVFPAKGENPEITDADLPDLLQRAANADGAHIIGFHQTGGQGRVAVALRTHFRFRWGSNEMLWSVAGSLDQFREHVESILMEEARWREHVMPADKSSPLILPKKVFEPLAGHADIWEECEMFNREVEHFEQLSKKIKHFAKEHTKPYQANQPSYMVDRDRLVWKDKGPYYAKAPFPRQWKYSLHVGEAFHYDVEHQQGREFTLTDTSGTANSIKPTKHINIDCHGFKSH
ncbi:MAG: hypothetical protein HHJ17_15595 [Rhodoferax sp.]|uniref:hypothetical protein n=1 Tax=Rhodoferax sp. TaxID=50421 RepID=UPI0017F90305|nr:hypothetical protein [Rhodoferax sp.]NMM14944.1 hypothetical protein [Rhodoferax sp.]